MGMDDQVKQLAEWFVYDMVKANHINRVWNATQAIQRYLAQGWKIHDLQHEIQLFQKTYPDLLERVYHLEEVIGNKQPPNNLMEPDVFYYHNHLREVPPPPRLRIVDGKAIREEQSFYLQMKTRFTMEDLLSYWYAMNGLKANEHMKKQDEGKFKYLLGFYNLDELLFGIDVSKSIRAERQKLPLRNAFDLEQYMDEAREYIAGKQNVHKQQGINKVIKKRDG
jgi:hypothetical protein